MNTTAIVALVRTDIRLYFSDRRAVIVGVLVPILIAAFFGYIFGGNGASGDAGKIPIAVVDEDQSSVSRAIAADLATDKLLQVSALDRATARAAVRAGKQNAAAVIPKGFGERTTRALFTGQDKPRVELLVDPSQTSGARVVEGLLAQYSMQEISRAAFTGASGRKFIDESLTNLENQQSTASNADLEDLLRAARKLNQQANATAGAPGAGRRRGFGLSIPYTVASTEVTARERTPYNGYAHAFAGMTVQFILFAGIDAGVLLLLTRQRGIWQRLRSAPLRRSDFMLARALATTLISLFQFTLIYLAAALVFTVRVEGSWPGFLGVGIAFCMLNAAFGLMLATLGRSAPTTRGFASMATLLLVMIGGAWVPAFVFPRWLQSASLYVPTRWAVDGLDGATWRGLPFDAAVAPIIVLIGSAAVCLAIAIWRFRWEE
ncbi:MAG: ABC transporter permease [Gammaproteobacteria bacterium]|nr:ABC transporter permease [Gammaproteobacteria bacterium]